MGFACAKRNVLTCLSALEATLRQFGYEAQWGKAVDCALSVYDGQ